MAQTITQLTKWTGGKNPFLQTLSGKAVRSGRPWGNQITENAENRKYEILYFDICYFSIFSAVRIFDSQRFLIPSCIRIRRGGPPFRFESVNIGGLGFVRRGTREIDPIRLCKWGEASPPLPIL